MGEKVQLIPSHLPHAQLFCTSLNQFHIPNLQLSPKGIWKKQFRNHGITSIPKAKNLKPGFFYRQLLHLPNFFTDLILINRPPIHSQFSSDV